ncbi:hypothetical protein HK097_011245 [Rhizophlyctis rosea]|uniref:Uncharacterized protein n=1 Tax=Rhizophlyctis rosea TaxID=64517 RepID=A0AAD5S9E2_9FUNG|nr:hypothetical protein HK097_011245 [Rhizophlyctis rosea]
MTKLIAIAFASVLAIANAAEIPVGTAQTQGPVATFNPGPWSCATQTCGGFINPPLPPCPSGYTCVDRVPYVPDLPGCCVRKASPTITRTRLPPVTFFPLVRLQRTS